MTSMARTVVVPVVLALLAGCDQKVDEGESKLTEGNQSVEVAYKGMTQTVHFDDLETSYLFNEQPVVALEDVVLGSGLVLDASDLWVNFLATDGYSPVCTGNCAAYTPVPGSALGQGWLERGTRRLLWEESLGYPDCLHVLDVETVELADGADGFECGGDADTDTDTDEPLDAIDIRYQGDSESVVLEGLSVDILGDRQVVLLTTLFATTSFVFDPEAVELEFEGEDGYNPTRNGQCAAHLPAPGVYANRAGVDTSTGRLEWDPDLGFTGCAFIGDLAIVFIDDIVAQDAQ